MFRRPFARPLRRALANDVPPLLRRANDLMASGNFLAAADAYEQLARGAQQRGIPRDAQLFMQAGRCRLQAGQVPAAMVDLKEGLGIIASRGNTQHLQRLGQRTMAELNQRGLSAEAQEIQSFLGDTAMEPLPSHLDPAPPSASPAAVPSAAPRLLPTKCPACGGPLRSNEVEWVDESTAECPFCGGAVRAG